MADEPNDKTAERMSDVLQGSVPPEQTWTRAVDRLVRAGRGELANLVSQLRESEAAEGLYVRADYGEVLIWRGEWEANVSNNPHISLFDQEALGVAMLGVPNTTREPGLTFDQALTRARELMTTLAAG